MPFSPGAAFPSRRIYSVACTKDPRGGLLQASVVLAFAPRVCLGFVPSVLFPSVVGSVRFVNGFSCLQISVLME